MQFTIIFSVLICFKIWSQPTTLILQPINGSQFRKYSGKHLLRRWWYCHKRNKYGRRRNCRVARKMKKKKERSNFEHVAFDVLGLKFVQDASVQLHIRLKIWPLAPRADLPRKSTWGTCWIHKRQHHTSHLYARVLLCSMTCCPTGGRSNFPRSCMCLSKHWRKSEDNKYLMNKLKNK